MTTPEGKIEKHLKKTVEASGGKVRKVKWIGKSGAPDRIMWWPKPPGILAQMPFAFVELKAPGKKPTKVQEIEHKALRDDGWTVLVVDSIQAADAAIAAVRGAKKDVVFSADGPAPRAKRPAAEYDVKSPANIPVMDNNDLV